MTQNEASYFQPHQVGDRSLKAGRSAREPGKVSSDISQGAGDTSMESNSSGCKAASAKKSKQKRLSLKVVSKVNCFVLACPPSVREVIRLVAPTQLGHKYRH